MRYRACAAALLMLFCIAPVVHAGVTTRVSVSSSGAQVSEWQYSTVYPALSADGRYVVFSSVASNLVTGDTNGVSDVFVRDRQSGQTTRVSVSSSGAEGNYDSFTFAISGDGRYVAFTSTASTLVEGDTNGRDDVFVHDRQTGETTRVSVSSSGTQGNDDSGSYGCAISADGRYVAYGSAATNLIAVDINGSHDVFVHDRQTGQTTRVSVNTSGIAGDGSSTKPALSADGRYVAFESDATNLVSGDTNASRDIFVRDRQSGQTTRVSVNVDGIQGNLGSVWAAISADGRYVGFESTASNLVAGDTNTRDDIFVYDRQTGQISRANVSSGGVQAAGYGFGVSLSADARYVTFASDASNLVSGDNNGCVDIFVRDRLIGETTRVSVSSAGAEANDDSTLPALSADGRCVAFYSFASNLVSGDTNGLCDTFVHDRAPQNPAQPDLWIRKTYDTGYAGDNVINTTGADQTRGTYANPLLQGQFIFRIQNDGNMADSFTILAPPAPAGWVTKYYLSPSNIEITHLVTGDGWTTGSLSPGASTLFYLMTRPLPSVPATTTFTRFITAKSVADPTKVDVVKTMTVVNNYFQPDLWLRTSTETLYTGDGLYTVAGQTKSQTVSPGIAAVYLFRVQNDGNVTWNYKLTAPAAPAGWTVQFFNTATSADITAQVTGSGWLTPALARGAHVGLYVKVTPGSTLASGTSYPLLLTAVMPYDITRKDVVQVVTTRR